MYIVLSLILNTHKSRFFFPFFSQASGCLNAEDSEVLNFSAKEGHSKWVLRNSPNSLSGSHISEHCVVRYRFL
jgi:hypothetical protein